MAGITGRVPDRRSTDGARRSTNRQTDNDHGPSAGFDRLLRTIEGEIIPRLVLAHRGQKPRSPSAAATGAEVAARQVGQFTDMLLTSEIDSSRQFIDDLQADGVTLDSVYLDLFAPAARQLGEMWAADQCDFTAVTLGLWRLQRLLHECSPQFHVEAVPPIEGRRILLAPMPGSQHTFGVFMVAEFFRRAGWDVVDGPVANPVDLVSSVTRNWFEIVGLSLSCDQRLDALAALIRDIRRSSRNRAIGIIVGGPVFVEHPDAVVRVDADVYAADAQQALLAAQDLLFALPQRQRAASAG